MTQPESAPFLVDVIGESWDSPDLQKIKNLLLDALEEAKIPYTCKPTHGQSPSRGGYFQGWVIEPGAES